MSVDLSMPEVHKRNKSPRKQIRCKLSITELKLDYEKLENWKTRKLEKLWSMDSLMIKGPRNKS